MQHAIGCEYLHIDVDGGQLIIECTAGVRKELRDQFIAACNDKLPWLTKEFVRTVCEIEHHDFISSGMFADEFLDNGPQEWTKHA